MSRIPLQELGLRVKRHRVAMKFSVRQLADLALVSKTSIMNLEQGKSCRPATLHKILSAMGLHLERVLTDLPASNGPEVRIHRREEERWFSLDALFDGPVEGKERALSEEERGALLRSGSGALMTHFRNLAPDLGVWAGIIVVEGHSEPRSHPGVEWVFVLSGTALITVGDQAHRLERGESIYFACSELHAYGSAVQNEPVSLMCLRFAE